jgi:hypothetical protein
MKNYHRREELDEKTMFIIDYMSEGYGQAVRITRKGDKCVG